MSDEPKKGTGFEKIPPILERPLIKDPFFFWLFAAAAFWIAVLWWLFS